MKFLPFALLLVLLASCGADKTEENVTENSGTQQAITEEVWTEIDESLDEMNMDETSMTDETTPMEEEVLADETLGETEEVMIIQESESEVQTVANEVVELTTSYRNPKGNVDMNISYSVDENDIITAISVQSDDYDLSDMNQSLQNDYLGLHISTAADYYKAGSSLSSEAFRDAVRESIY